MSLFMNKNKSFVVFFYMMSFILFMSSHHWFMLWCCMELSTAMFFCMVVQSKQEMESGLIYFSTQSLSSFLLVIFICSNPLYLTNGSELTNTCITMILCFKLGAAPFYGWFIASAATLQKMVFYLIMTTQKIMPFLLISTSAMSSMNLLLLIASLTFITGSCLNLVQSNVKNLIVFSSVTHLGWFLMAISMSIETWLLYFMLYCLLLYSLLGVLFMNIGQTLFVSKLKKMLLMLGLLTLSGLPPLAMFMPKLMVFFLILTSSEWNILFVMIMSSTMDFFIYLRASLSLTFKTSPLLLWSPTTTKTRPLTLMLLISLLPMWVITFL